MWQKPAVGSRLHRRPACIACPMKANPKRGASDYSSFFAPWCPAWVDVGHLRKGPKPQRLAESRQLCQPDPREGRRRQLGMEPTIEMMMLALVAFWATAQSLLTMESVLVVGPRIMIGFLRHEVHPRSETKTYWYKCSLLTRDSLIYQGSVPRQNKELMG